LMGASNRQVLTKVILPSAVAWVFAGLRLSVPYALIGAIVGELIAANQGLGYLLSDASGQFNTAGVFAALLAIVLLAMTLNFIVRILEKLAMPWLQEQDQREFSI
jgi:NitT/TauT family transport system permease protein